MSKGKGFVALRRAILEHIETRKLTVTEYAALITIMLLADKANGVWFGCAVALAAKFGDGSMNQKAATRALHYLDTAGYIKRFRTHGQRGNFPILVNKYEITVGGLKGCLINADATTDWQHPATYRGSDAESDEGSDVGGDVGTLSTPNSATPQHLKPLHPKNTENYIVGPTAKNFSARREKQANRKIVKVKPIGPTHSAEISAAEWKDNPLPIKAALLTFDNGPQTVADWDGQQFSRKGEVFAL